MAQDKDKLYQEAVELHRKHVGKLGVQARVSVTTKEDLSLVYSPGVAEPCRVIAQDPDQAYDLTWKGRTVAVVSDGSAVLGLGNIGAEASLPVMEGKSLLMKDFAGVDSIPLVVRSQEAKDIIEFVKQVAPTFAGINLEDIAAPKCFEVEDALQDIGIPVFHDDQHGTAIVVRAGLENACKVVGKSIADLKVVIVGAGAAGIATAKMLLGLDGTWDSLQQVENFDVIKQLTLVDSKGIVHASRTDIDADKNRFKKALLPFTNTPDESGDLAQALMGADVVIGVSGPGLITADMVKSMADKPIIFGLANPTPEIMPDLAHQAGAAVVATGRSDFPNQVNNVLAFPGIFKAILMARLPQITMKLKIAAARALAEMVTEPHAEAILPNPFEPGVSTKVAEAVVQAYQEGK